jgi:hypothetical protein
LGIADFLFIKGSKVQDTKVPVFALASYAAARRVQGFRGSGFAFDLNL